MAHTSTFPCFSPSIFWPKRKKKDFKASGCGTVSSRNVWRLVWSQQVEQNLIYRHKTITFLFKASVTRISVKCPLGHKHLVSPGSPLENVSVCGVSDSRPLWRTAASRLVVTSCFRRPLVCVAEHQIKSGGEVLSDDHTHTFTHTHSLTALLMP